MIDIRFESFDVKMAGEVRVSVQKPGITPENEETLLVQFDR